MAIVPAGVEVTVSQLKHAVQCSSWDDPPEHYHQLVERHPPGNISSNILSQVVASISVPECRMFCALEVGMDDEEICQMLGDAFLGSSRTSFTGNIPLIPPPLLTMPISPPTLLILRQLQQRGGRRN